MIDLSTTKIPTSSNCWFSYIKLSHYPPDLESADQIACLILSLYLHQTL